MYARGDWNCQECGASNECSDEACECQHEAERREGLRRDAIERARNLSVAERRERLRRAA